MKKLLLNPNEMAIRKVYFPLVLSHKLTTFFRPGVRLCQSLRGYCQQQSITLRSIVQPGIDSLGIAPQFSHKEQVRANIARIYSKKILDLNEEDFAGASPDIKNINELKYHLGLIYNLDLDHFSDDFYVTVIKVKYPKEKIMKKEPVKRLENLLQCGMWKIAKEPPANALDMDSKELMITLIAHDYQARTPLLWNKTFAHFKIPAKSLVLVPADSNIDQTDLRFTFDTYRDDTRFKLGGLGVGFKDKSLNLLDKLDDSAAKVGAANFILKDSHGDLVGYNTDGEGFVSGLMLDFPQLKSLKDKKVLLLGSGGTANALAFALAKRGAQIIIANRTLIKAQALAEAVNKFYDLNLAQALAEDSIENHLSTINIIINASIKGAHGELADYLAISATEAGLAANYREGKRLLALVSKQAVICDVVLRAKDTPLIAEAKAQGFKTLDGLPMVIAQAALAFNLAYGKTYNITFAEVYNLMRKIKQ